MAKIVKYTELWNNTSNSINSLITDQPYSVLFDDAEYTMKPRETVNHAGIGYSYLGSFCDGGTWRGHEYPFCICWPTTDDNVRSVEFWAATPGTHEAILCRKDGTGDFVVSISNATKTTAGKVKQAENVPEAAGEAPTAAEFKALLDALIAAGIMAAPATT